MAIEIRPLATHEEYRAAEGLQRVVWGLDDVRIVPDNVMIVAQKNGGLVLGAFDEAAAPPHLVGYVQGFVGLRDGKLKHYSHQLGVLPAYQNQQIGYRLKLAQRDYVRAQGIDLITWTYDPLESRNAYLNLHKLGAVCNLFWPNLYGAMRDALNQGLASDRFEVVWHINSAHVERRLAGTSSSPALAELLAAHVLLLNPAPAGEPALPPPADALPTDQRFLLLEIPAHFQDVKAAAIEQAHLWRERTRSVFETAFAAGYTIVDLLIDQQQPYYLFEKDWTPT